MSTEEVMEIGTPRLFFLLDGLKAHCSEEPAGDEDNVASARAYPEEDEAKSLPEYLPSVILCLE